MADPDALHEWLSRAANHAFFLDVGDAAARLCRANVVYGLAKMHAAQLALGVEPDATFVSTPDATVTRNVGRWTAGFGYGGAFAWSGSFFPLELKPNCCGVVAAGLDRLPPLERCRARVARLAETPLEVDGVQAHWDMHRGNHFINVYRVEDPSITAGHEFLVVMHSSGSELRGPNPRGPGLYLNDDPSRGLAAIAERLDTPFGTMPIVRDRAAQDYVAYVAAADRFAHARRAAYVDALFGNRAEILFNETHQGLDGEGRMLLGCYSTRALRGAWVPVTLRPDLPAFLVQPGAVYGADTLTREGLMDQAAHIRDVKRLTHADLLPHGGGYAFPWAGDAPVQVDDGGASGQRRFRFGDGDWFEHVRDLPFTYRGEEVVGRLEQVGAGRVATRLELVQRLEG